MGNTFSHRLALWGDPKGGASGNAPPVLTIGERIAQSLPYAVALALLLFVTFRRIRRRFRVEYELRNFHGHDPIIAIDFVDTDSG